VEGIKYAATNSVMIAGAHFKDYAVRAAITIGGCSNITITGCSFTNDIIYPIHHTNITVMALHLMNSTDITIANNSFIGNIATFLGDSNIRTSMIRFDNSSNIIFEKNIIENNRCPELVVFDTEENYYGSGSISIRRNLIKYNESQVGTVIINNLSPNVSVLFIGNQVSYNANYCVSLGAGERSAGVNIDGGQITVKENTFSYNHSVLGGGLYVVLRGEIFIEENQIFRNTYGGGMYIVSKQIGYDGLNNPIYSQSANTVQRFYLNNVFENVGGAMYVANTFIKYTTAPSTADLVDVTGGFYFLMNSFIDNVRILPDDSAITVNDGEIALINCLIVGNVGKGLYLNNYYDNKRVISVNSVFWGNDSPQISARTTSINDDTSYFYYTIVEGLSTGIQLQNVYMFATYDADPMFVDRYSHNWHITNTVYGTLPPYFPFVLNFDPFIGLAEYNNFTEESLYTREFLANQPTPYYISFPKLPRDANTNDAVPFYDPLNRSNDISHHFEYQFTAISTIDPITTNILSTLYAVIPPIFNGWSEILPPFTSTNGYILIPNEAFSISIKGSTINPNTVIPLRGNQENWIGYFLPRTVPLFDAFSPDILANIVSIESYDGTIHNIPNNGFLSSSRERTISYGDMVKVVPNMDIDFHWETGREVFPSRHSKSTQFAFTPLPSYTSVYIEVDPQDIPDELAVFVNGVCKGATVYQGKITEILAYLDKGDINQEIQIVYGYHDGSPHKIVTDFALVNHQTNQLEYRPIIARSEKKYHHVKLSQKDPVTGITSAPAIQLHQNYPNPFNPETKIDFYLSIDDNISLSIYNIKGQKVKDLYSGFAVTGVHSVVWNGKDSDNRSVSSGVYLYKLNTSKGSVQKKMLLLK